MRILTFKRVLYLGALAYGYQYVKKHGGVRNAWNELAGKARMAMRDASVDTTGTRHEASTSESTGYSNRVL